MIRRPPRATRTFHSFPTRRSSDLCEGDGHPVGDGQVEGLAEVVECPHQLTSGALEAQGIVELEVERHRPTALRSEEHTSELQSLMRISYAVFCLKKKKINNR